MGNFKVYLNFFFFYVFVLDCCYYLFINCINFIVSVVWIMDGLI